MMAGVIVLVAVFAFAFGFILGGFLIGSTEPNKDSTLDQAPKDQAPKAKILTKVPGRCIPLVVGLDKGNAGYINPETPLMDNNRTLWVTENARILNSPTAMVAEGLGGRKLRLIVDREWFKNYKWRLNEPVKFFFFEVKEILPVDKDTLDSYVTIREGEIIKYEF